MPLFKVKNWQDFQHYKFRRPPWIRLYRQLLDDHEFMALPDASFTLAINLWLIASERNDGQIDMSLETMAWRLRRSKEWVIKAMKPLLDKGFIELCQQDASNMLASCKQDASNMLASCKQDAMSESETETETETESFASNMLAKAAAPQITHVSEPKKRPKKEPDLADDAFFESLKTDPQFHCYPRILIDTNRPLAAQWAKDNKRDFTKRFFLSWLKRETLTHAATQPNASGLRCQQFIMRRGPFREACGIIAYVPTEQEPLPKKKLCATHYREWQEFQASHIQESS